MEKYIASQIRLSKTDEKFLVLERMAGQKSYRVYLECLRLDDARRVAAVLNSHESQQLELKEKSDAPF